MTQHLHGEFCNIVGRCAIFGATTFAKQWPQCKSGEKFRLFFCSTEFPPQGLIQPRTTCSWPARHNPGLVSDRSILVGVHGWHSTDNGHWALLNTQDNEIFSVLILLSMVKSLQCDDFSSKCSQKTQHNHFTKKAVCYTDMMPWTVVITHLGDGPSVPTFVTDFPAELVSFLYYQVHKTPLGLVAIGTQNYKISDIICTLSGNKIVDHSDVVGASPVGAAPTTSSFSTWHVAPIYCTKTTARWKEKHLIFWGCGASYIRDLMVLGILAGQIQGSVRMTIVIPNWTENIVICV